MDRHTLIERARSVIEKEPRLVLLPPEGDAVFVGDTHGDLDASEQVFRRFERSASRIVFLGDYVDRGRYSEENISYLLEKKLQYPERVYLLGGNHEGFGVTQFFPANFWESLSEREVEQYHRLFSVFPLAAASENGILALHGGLPELGCLDEFNGIRWGDANWTRIVWGDFVEREGEILGSWAGRPQLGYGYFRRLMGCFKKHLLIRSHQPNAPTEMFGGRCVTVFTSRAYLPRRTVVVVNMESTIRSAKDIKIEEI